jgi:hypothetical protein
MMKRSALALTVLALAMPFYSLFGNLITRAAQRIDSKIRRVNGHPLNMELAEQRLGEKFKKAGVAFPPAEVTLAYFKDTQELLLYAGAKPGALKLIHRYPVLAASGKAGPKLREGDEQVPEGVYRIVLLNPKSQFHLSLRVNYPNEQDRAQAAKEGRTKLGGDIMIHGEAVSIGCIAIGNVAIEEIYRLGERTEFRRWTVLLSPVDFRAKKLPGEAHPPWMAAVYRTLEQRLRELP